MRRKEDGKKRILNRINEIRVHPQTIKEVFKSPPDPSPDNDVYEQVKKDDGKTSFILDDGVTEKTVKLFYIFPL